MPTFSANLSMLFRELPFIERFSAARKAGFDHVECWFPYEFPVSLLRTVLDDNDLELVGINSAPGETGEWGIAALPGRSDDFRKSIHQAIDYGHGLGAAVHVMAGLVGGIERNAAEGAYLDNLAYAIEAADAAGVQLLIEPLNSRDRPGYFLRTADQAAAIIARQGFQNLKMMFDIYHVQLESGDLTGRLRRHFPIIGHIQIAGIPDRHEPDHGEVNYEALLGELQRLGWAAPIGAEYNPRHATEEGLSWLKRWTKEPFPL